MTAAMIRALGMMSGTSLDGVDAAEIITDGEHISQFGRSAFRAYEPGEVDILHNALGKWHGEDGVACAARFSVQAHASLAGQFPDCTVIGYHGQTLAHDPGGRGTHQAGSGADLARATGRRVVWDFRSEDVRQGGQGAPLAPFFHWACARWAMERGLISGEPVGFLNLGGVGNLTWVDPRKPTPENGCVAFDTGPANAPINDMMRLRGLGACDEGGALARSGQPDTKALATFLKHPYFTLVPPKSLDRDAFSGLAAAVADLGPADAAATLVAAIAGSVASGLAFLPKQPAAIFVCGGGRHNMTIMAALQKTLDARVLPVEAIGLDGDMLEAQAFGWLAVRVLRGLATSGPTTTGVRAAACGGRISSPRASGGR